MKKEQSQLFCIFDLVCWNRDQSSAGICNMISTYGAGPFRVVELKLRPLWQTLPHPLEVTIELSSGGERHNFAGEWFQRVSGSGQVTMTVPERRAFLEEHKKWLGDLLVCEYGFLDQAEGIPVLDANVLLILQDRKNRNQPWKPTAAGETLPQAQ